MTALIALLKEPEGLRMNGGALAYAVAAYVLGIAGLLHPSWSINAVATILLAHGMVIAAYLIHECGHNLVFRHSRHNAMLGRAMSWLCGASYGTYEDMRYKHFRHHVDNDDVVWFEYDDFFEEHPLIMKTARTLEWFYVPAHDLVMHVLRFMDMLQHDYPYNPTLFEYVQPPHKGDDEWELEHTFSVPLSLKYPWLSRITLNFGYHNAHHADMNVPWYRLPALHEQLTGNDPKRVIPFASQLKLYHRNRQLRVYNPQPGDYPKGAAYLRMARAGEGATGGNAASFLASF